MGNKSVTDAIIESTDVDESKLQLFIHFKSFPNEVFIQCNDIKTCQEASHRLRRDTRMSFRYNPKTLQIVSNPELIEPKVPSYKKRECGDDSKCLLH
jgi:hypothetical protein